MVSQINARPHFSDKHQFLPAHKFIVFSLLVTSLFSALTALASIPETEPAASLELNDSERLWLTTHPTVSFTGDPNWLPYEAFDSNGKYIGIVSGHLDLIAALTGAPVQDKPE